MNDLGKILVGLGALLIVVGAVVLVLGRLNVPIGRLPGDIAWKSKSGNTQVYFPVVTCIVISLILSLISWFISSRR